jgi:hypothetical protein
LQTKINTSLIQALSESSKIPGSPLPPDQANEMENRKNKKVRQSQYLLLEYLLTKFYQATNAAVGSSEDESSYSSFYSSFLKSDENPTSSNEGQNENDSDLWDSGTKYPLRRSNPQWLDNVDLTNDLCYKYQINTKTLPETLTADLFSLKKINQVRNRFERKFKFPDNISLRILINLFLSPPQSTTNYNSFIWTLSSKDSPQRFRSNQLLAAVEKMKIF